MVLNSQIFVFLFLPLVFILNTAVMLFKKPLAVRISNGLLLAASLVFYAWGDPVMILVLVTEALFGYVIALLAERASGRTKKLWLVLGAIICIGTLCFYKYTSFLLSIFGIHYAPVDNMALPLGISFYTFNLLSYIVDVYKGKVRANKNFARVLLFVAFFPRLTAGPIMKYDMFYEKMESRVFDVKETAEGVRRFIIGLAKKLFIANTVALVVDNVFALTGSSLKGAAAWVGAICYMFQIYFDFSGYSDMAIGVGHMFGFDTCENFNYPYTALTVKDFWRRWHISVSTWFRDYLYIPLGGNRKGKFRTSLNKIIVFFFTGLWHGANFTFIIWGLWHGFFLLIEEYVGPFFKGKKYLKPLGYVYTMLVVCLGFVMFRADNVMQGFRYIGTMFTSWGGFSAVSSALGGTLNVYTLFIIMISFIAMLPVSKWLSALGKKAGCEQTFEVLSYVYVAALFAISLLALASSTYNPFIYIKF